MSAPTRGLPGERRAGLLMAAPAVLGLAVFVAFPFALAVALSLTDRALASPLETRFVGLQQYARILTDPTFLRALANNGIFAAVAVPLQTGIALGIALALDRPRPGRALFRTAFFLPVVFPLSLVSIVWALLFAPGPDGKVNALLDAITFGAWEPRDFVRDPRWALPAVLVTSIWQGLGFQVVILLAALQGVRPSLHDAAAVDGAGPVARFVHVTLPQIRRGLLFVVLVTTILSFRVFDQVRILTRGGPDDASTTVVFESVRAAFDEGDVARGSAMTVVFTAVVLALTLAIRALGRRGGDGA